MLQLKKIIQFLSEDVFSKNFHDMSDHFYKR